MSSSTWRVLKGYAKYQRTPVRMISCGKWAPLKLTGIVSLPLVAPRSQREIIPQIASNKNCDRTPASPRPASASGPADQPDIRDGMIGRATRAGWSRRPCTWWGPPEYIRNPMPPIPPIRIGIPSRLTKGYSVLWGRSESRGLATPSGFRRTARPGKL
jgi:hypothetical protein